MLIAGVELLVVNQFGLAAILPLFTSLRCLFYKHTCRWFFVFCFKYSI